MYPIENIRRAVYAALILLISISGSAQLKAGFASDINSGCSPFVVHFQDQSTGNPTQWLWDLGNGTISHQQHPTGTYFQPGTYDVKLVIKSAAGSDSIVKNQFIIVRANPVVAFTVSDSSGCFPKTFLFNDQSNPGSGTITQRTWDFGDGNVSTASNPTHTYTQAGSYSVILKVVNSYGCQSIFTRPNMIRLSQTVADFNSVNTGGCQLPAGVVFTNLSQGAAQFIWDFGDGGQSSAANPTHTYTSAGTYNVRLISVSNSGCADTVIKQVVTGKGIADFRLASQACVGTPVLFQNTSSLVPVAALWSFGDGTTSTQINADKIFNAPGSYQVRLISNFGTCADTITKNITVHAKPTAAFIASGDLSKCSPNAIVSFSNTSSGAANYVWHFGDGITSSVTSPAHTYTGTGIFDVSLVAINSSGCRDSITRPALVKIQRPKISSISGVPYSGCAPYTAHLSAVINSPEPVIKWEWNFGDGNTSNVAAPAHVYAAPGTYDIQLVITTTGGCSDTITYAAAVRVSNKPQANFSAAPLTVCASEKVTFTNLSTGSTQWLWVFGDDGFSTEQNPVHQFADTGIFTVKLIAFSNTGCSDTFVVKDYVRNDPPVGRYRIIQDCANPFVIQFRDTSSGGQRYKWKFGDGDSSDLKHPVHTYSAPGTYRVEFIVYHGSCYYYTSGEVKIVDEHPKLTFTDTILCKSTSAVLTAGNINASNIASYYWDFGNGSSATTTTPVYHYNYTVAGSYFPKLITTDILGCMDTVAAGSISAKIYGPKAGFSNLEGTCVDRSVLFNDTSVTDGVHNLVEWQWRLGDGSVQTYTSPAFNHTYHSKGNFDVTLRVKDTYGCYDSIFKPAAVIITDPVAAFSSADPIKCSGNTVLFNNQSDGLNLVYAWQFGDNNVSTAANPQHSYSTQSEFNVKLIATDQYGCKDTLIQKQVISNPVAVFNASDTFSTCPPLLVNLNNQSTHFTNLTWNFGDGSTSISNNPSHYYTTPGKYDLKLYVNGFGNCRDSASKTVIVKGPTGSFSFSPGTICTDGSVNFRAKTSGNTRFVWDFSDGFTHATTDSVVSHDYDIPGYYQPKLILIDTAGCQVAVTTPDTIKVLGAKARIGRIQHLFCDSVGLQFSDSSIVFNDLPSRYRWNFGDGNSSGIANPLHRYVQPGNYTVRLTITTQAGCIDSVVMPFPVSIIKSPQIAVDSRSSVCIYDTLLFTGRQLVQDTSVIQWNWNFANGMTSRDQSPSFSYTSAGNSTVRAIATNSSGCSDTASLTILVHPLPNVKAGTDTMICRGQSYILQPTGAVAYTWQSDPSLSCVDCSAPIVNPAINKVYYVKGTSQFGCEASDSVIVNVMQPFTMKVSNNDTLCAGDKIQLIANGAANYSWFPANGLSDASSGNPVASPSGTTDYRVIGSDALNCFRDTAHVKLNVFPIPQFNITESAMVLSAGSTAAIHSTGSADITHWKWYPAKDLSCADCPEPVVIGKDNITYRAEVWNDGGCAATDKITVSVICGDGNVFIPNTFSPNSDGMNDVFYVRGKGINSVKSMKVFNRLGELMFEGHDFNANDVNTGWNGTYKSSKLTPDVYVYIVDVVCSNNTVFTLKGNVTLIR